MKAYTHDLSTTAYDAVRQANVEDPNSIYMQLKPLLAGGVAALTFPTVSLAPYSGNKSGLLFPSTGVGTATT